VNGLEEEIILGMKVMVKEWLRGRREVGELECKVIVVEKYAC